MNIMNLIYYILLILSLLLTGFSIYKTSISKNDINVKLMLYGLSLHIYIVIMITYEKIKFMYELNEELENSFFDKPFYTMFNIPKQINNLLNYYNKPTFLTISTLVARIISFSLLLIGLIWWIAEYVNKQIKK